MEPPSDPRLLSFRTSQAAGSQAIHRFYAAEDPQALVSRLRIQEANERHRREQETLATAHRRQLQRWSYAAFLVILVAVFVFASIVVLAEIGSTEQQDRAMSLIGTVLGAIVGAVAGFAVGRESR